MKLFVKLMKYINMIHKKPLDKINIKNKGLPLNNILPKLLNTDLEHRQNLIKIIANKNINKKKIIDHFSNIPIHVLNHYHDYIVLLINNPNIRDKSISLLLN